MKKSPEHSGFFRKNRFSVREKGDRRENASVPNFSKKLRSSLRRVIPKRKCGRSLLQSTPMAHRLDRLVLLYPYPDTVHGGLLHKTLLSSRLTSRSRPYGGPRRAFSLAIADCKFRAPLSPRSAQCNHFTPNFKKKQGFYVSNKKIIVENRPRGFEPRNFRIKIPVKTCRKLQNPLLY